jgi:hypothetical protein
MHKLILYLALFFTPLAFGQFLNCDTSWTLPMSPPVELSAGFGDLRPNHFHMGIDIRTGGRENLPIYAIQDGYISRLKVSAVGYGWVLYVAHPNGYTSVYAHCNKYAPAIQDFYLDTSEVLQQNEVDLLLPANKIVVKKGELIAYSGNTGGSSGPHLHFELRQTKTEHALNPLLHGFNVSDSGQPVLGGIRIYAVDPNGYEVPTKSYVVTLGQLQHTAILPAGFLREGDRIGLALQVDDYFSKGGRTLGLFSAEVWTENSGHFAFELAEIDFDDARYINTHHDHAYAQLSKRKFQKLFKTRNNPLTIYPYEGTGTFELNAQDSLQFAIMLRDVNGNESQHQLWVKNPYPKTAAKMTYTNVTHWLPTEAYFYEAGPWQLQIDSFTFFEPVRKSLDLAAKRIASSQLQLAKPITLSCQLKDSITAHRYVITMNGAALPTTYKEGKLTAYSKTLGTFGLKIDEIAPTIQNQTNNKLDTLNNGMWSWLVKDECSGVASYSCYQNGKWVPAYFDAKNKVVKARFQVPFVAGTVLEIRVKDAAGNERVLQSSTPLAPFK